MSSSCNYDYEIANPMDFNGDGLVNNLEFAIFADAWLAHDPNDPGYSPDPEEYVRWSKVRDYNFDKNGTSQYQIDLADFVIFVEDWAWRACWKDLEKGFSMMEMGGGMQMMSMDSVSSETLTAPQPEPTIEEQIKQTEDALDFFDEVLKDEEVKQTIDLDNLQKVIDDLEDQLEALKDEL